MVLQLREGTLEREAVPDSSVTYLLQAVNQGSAPVTFDLALDDIVVCSSDIEGCVESIVGTTTDITLEPGAVYEFEVVLQLSDSIIPDITSVTRVIALVGGTPVSTLDLTVTVPTATSTPLPPDLTLQMRRGDALQEAAPGATVRYQLSLINEGSTGVDAVVAVAPETQCSTTIPDCTVTFSGVGDTVFVAAGSTYGFDVFINVPDTALLGQVGDTRIVVSVGGQEITSLLLGLTVAAPTATPTSIAAAPVDVSFVLVNGNIEEAMPVGGTRLFDLRLVNNDSEEVTAVIVFDEDVRCGETVPGCRENLLGTNVEFTSVVLGVNDFAEIPVFIDLPDGVPAGVSGQTRVVALVNGEEAASITLTINVIPPEAYPPFQTATAAAQTEQAGNAPYPFQTQTALALTQTARPNTPACPAQRSSGGRSCPSPTPTPVGRLTGTVIDLCTNVPAPGIDVRVGDSIVVTDLNGNYERFGLNPGVYTVDVVLARGAGEQAQDPLLVEVGLDRAVQHLAYFSPPCAGAAPVPPAPGTNQQRGVPAQPIMMPHTAPAAPPQQSNIGWLWLLAGGVLCLGGGWLRWRR
ncbi:MAG: carboxypeptidase-like regulatory domain-containing protein [Chloroflexaceae bacterium]|nr:carboxypeptidase-like regulatory domain-containing protein [Chloroflexaceae bacterium]